MEGDPRNPRVSLLKKYDIPIDHLTYEYVEKCTNKKELERIIRILRSGEEGSYPDLLRVTEDRLRSFAPESRVLRVETPILTKDALPSEEWKAVESELLSWEEEMRMMDKSLDFEKGRMDTVGNKNMPAIRKVVQAPKKPEINNKKVMTDCKNERIKSGDYAAWDKFDVDKELLKIDVEEERKQEENERKKREVKKQHKENKVEIVDISKDSFSCMEQQVLANQAKDRGNECYKSGDLENALKYYNISINLYSTANAFNNRAMTYLKLKQYENAIKDCNKVLDLDKNNIKALHRRATAYQSMCNSSNDELALKDLMTIIQIEPNNKVAQADLQKLKKKLNIEDIGKKFRMPIYENDQDPYTDKKAKGLEVAEKKSLWNIKDNSVATEKLPLTYYGPSTSNFMCEPYSMAHRALSGSPLLSSGQVVCKCNSNRPRQNPLCQRCGEEIFKSRSFTRTEEVTKSSKKKDNEAKNQLLKENSKKTQNTKCCSDNNSKDSLVTKVESKLHDVADDKAQPALEEASNEKLDVKHEMLCKSGNNSIVNKKLKSEETFETRNLVRPKERANLLNVNECKSTNSTVNDSELINVNKFGSVDLNKEGKTCSNNKTDLNNTCSMRDEKNLGEVREDETYVEGSDTHKNLDEGKSKECNTEAIPNLEEVKTSLSKIKISETQSSLNNGVINSECSFNESDVKISSKKLKNKKRKSKERKECLIKNQLEPIKVVHAAKYLHPTSVEPKEPKVKRENVNFKSQDDILSTSCQFKAFTPNKQCLSTELGRKDSSGESYLSSIAKNSFENYQGNEKIKSDLSLEGNKENILENKSVNSVEGRGKESTSQQYNIFKYTVESSFEFTRTWEELKKTDGSYAKRAEIIRLIKPSDLGKVIGIKLDSEMLSCLLECLERHFVESDPKIVVEFLNQLPQVPRFGLVKMFLADHDKNILKKLIETTENKGFTLDEDIKKTLTNVS